MEVGDLLQFNPLTCTWFHGDRRLKKLDVFLSNIRDEYEQFIFHPYPCLLVVPSDYCDPFHLYFELVDAKIPTHFDPFATPLELI